MIPHDSYFSRVTKWVPTGPTPPCRIPPPQEYLNSGNSTAKSEPSNSLEKNPLFG